MIISAPSLASLAVDQKSPPIESASSSCETTSRNDNDIAVSMPNVSSARGNAAATSAVAADAAAAGVDASPGVKAQASIRELPVDDMETISRAVRALELRKLRRQLTNKKGNNIVLCIVIIMPRLLLLHPLLYGYC